MAEGNIFFFAIAGAVAGIGLFIMAFVWLKQKRLIENIPTSKVRSIALGLVEVFGQVVPMKDRILKSPFSKKDCVYYKYMIEELRRTKDSSHWATVKKGEESAHFYLKDDTGHVLVNPKGAKVDVPIAARYESRLGIDPPVAVMDFIKANNVSFESLFGMNKTMRYTEWLIPPNEKFYIMGTADKNPFVASSAVGSDLIMIKKGQHNKFYYISNKPEHEIVKSLKWKVIGGFLGGPVLLIAGLAIILFYLKII